MILLQSIDQHWREHLAALDYLRQGIHLRGYAQKNPKQEYKREAFELFSQLLDVVKMDVTRVLMSVRIQSEEEVARAAEAIEERAEHISNVTYTHPNDDGSVSQEPELATAGAADAGGGRGAARNPGRAGAGAELALGAIAAGMAGRARRRRYPQGRPQRPVSLRQRQEVQAVPREAGVGRTAAAAPEAAAPKVRNVRIDSGSDGQRLDNFLAKILKGVPKTHLYRVIRSGEVRVNKGRAAADTRLGARRRGPDPADAHRRSRGRAGRARPRVPGGVRGRASAGDRQAGRRGRAWRQRRELRRHRAAAPRPAAGRVSRAGASPRQGDLRPAARGQDEEGAGRAAERPALAESASGPSARPMRRWSPAPGRKSSR